MKTAIKNWQTTLAGNSGAALLFLQSWLANGHKLNWHDPALLIGLVIALLGIVAGDGAKQPNA